MSVISESAKTVGVGGLSEKAIHKILKLAIEPRVEMHEVSFCGSIADVMNECGIYEIQTRNHHKLIPKLKKFLPKTDVTVVVPLVRASKSTNTKHLLVNKSCWIPNIATRNSAHTSPKCAISTG